MLRRRRQNRVHIGIIGASDQLIQTISGRVQSARKAAAIWVGVMMELLLWRWLREHIMMSRSRCGRGGIRRRVGRCSARRRVEVMYVTIRV